MNFLNYYGMGMNLFFLVVLYMLPAIGFAEDTSLTGTGAAAGGGGFETLLVSILKFSNNILIPFILGIGFLVFVWGMFQYFIVGGASDDQKEKGKNLAIYSVLAFVLVIVFWGIINLIVGTLGLSKGADGTKQTFTVPGGVTSRSSSEAAEGDGTCGGDLVTGELIDC